MWQNNIGGLNFQFDARLLHNHMHKGHDLVVSKIYVNIYIDQVTKSHTRAETNLHGKGTCGKNIHDFFF